MELEGQQESQEEAPAAPEAPALDPIQLAAQQLGVDANVLVDSVRLQEENRRVFDENRRRQREIELERVKVEALRQERQSFQPQRPSYDDLDPVSRRILERLDERDRRDEERDRRDREKEEMQVRAQEQGAVLHSHYQALMRTLPTQNQVDPETFFDGAMRELWPNGVPEEVGPQKAVQITARYMGLQTNGAGPTAYAQPRTNPLRDPRLTITVPTGPTGGTASPQGNENDMQQRAGESLEQYGTRMRAWWTGKKFNDIVPEGGRISSG